MDTRKSEELNLKQDLSKELTVFVVSSGNNPNYNNCLEALKQQTVLFKVDIIKDFHPMSVAFQEMLNRCTTKFYIELDEDMILLPNSILCMYNGIKQSDEKVSMVGYRLHDTHYDFIIYGVKIYKFEIFKNYPYDLKSMSCEMEQLERMKLDGYTYDLKEDILGEHSPLWTEELIYDRYFNLMEKFKEFKYVWMETIPQKLFEKFQKEPTKLNLYALLGSYYSIIHQDKVQIGEKDFTKTRTLEMARMQSYLEPPITSSFYLTSKCNFKCTFCRRQQQDVIQSPDMSLDLVGDILRKFPTIKSVCVAGQGEPLLCDSFLRILRYLIDNKIFVGLVTNGSLLKEKFNEIVLKPPHYISISLNAPNAKVHKEINGTNTFFTVLDGITLCVNAKIDTYLSYVCTKQNLQYVSEFLSLAKRLNVKSVHLHNLVPHYKDSDDGVFWSLVLTKDDEKLIELLKQDPNASIVSRFPILIDRNEIRRECKFPWKTMNFDGNGFISICPSVCEPRKENGHIQDFVLWHNDYCNDLRESILSEQKKYCQKCFRNWEV
jgi:MoaA/NifB/PqqE/SkfB family radical SAM enzyme